MGHATVREALKYYPDGTLNPMRDDISDTFAYAGWTVERIDEDYPFRQPWKS